LRTAINADVFENTATRNTGGILVFDLPGLPQQGGHSIRVFNNVITDNNTPNFAPAGNIVAGVPTGTGVLIMANSNVHVFENEIGDNGTINVLISAYRESFQDANYNPLARDIVIRDNAFGNTGLRAGGRSCGAGAARRADPGRAVGWRNYVFARRHAAFGAGADRREREPLDADRRRQLPVARHAGRRLADHRSRAHSNTTAFGCDRRA
jgi:hypothetical protein